RKQPLLHVAPLVRSQLLPDSLALAKFLLLRWAQFIPRFKTLADARLLIGRHILEALVILQKFVLLVRRHFLEPLHGPGRQITVSISAGVHAIASRKLRTAWRTLVDL